jgi:hypothetical protein
LIVNRVNGFEQSVGSTATSLSQKVDKGSEQLIQFQERLLDILSEVNNKSDTSHSHTDLSPSTHNHNQEYSPQSHTHSELIKADSQLVNQVQSLQENKLDKDSPVTPTPHAKSHTMGNDQIPLATEKNRGLASPQLVKKTDKALKMASEAINKAKVLVSGVGSNGGSGTTINELNDVGDVDLTSVAQGDVLYNDGSDWVNLSAGADGQFLKTQGTGANPTWATVSGSGDMLISVYDAAGVSEQLVGLTAIQTLTNKTLTTPTIASFTNATHDHSDGSGGGTLSHTSLTAIGSNTHDQIDTHIGAANPHSGSAASGANSDITSMSGITGGISEVDSIQFDIDAAPSHSEGAVSWNDDDKTIDIHTEVTGTKIQVGQEIVLRVTNETGSTIVDGSIVYISGAQGSRPTITLSDSDIGASANKTIGIVTADILNTNTGYVTIFGLVRDVDTSSFSAGDLLYVGPTAGIPTNVAPSFPEHIMRIGYCVFSNVGSGIILVATEKGEHLENLYEVTITGTPGDNELLSYDTSSSQWINQTAAEAGLSTTSDLSTHEGDTSTHGVADLTALITADSTNTLTNKTFDGNGTGNSISNIDLSTDVISNLPVTNLNSGTNAGDTTFWRGDGTWVTPSGSGDVSKVGTPVDNQIGVWTGDGTIEGTSGLTYDGSNLQLTGDIGSTGTRITKGWYTDLQVTNAIAGSITGNAATVSTITGLAPDTATTQATQASITTCANLTTIGTVTTGNVDAVVSSANLTTAGKVELATVAETTTGTDATRSVTPDGLAGSIHGQKSFCIATVGSSTATSVGSGTAFFVVPVQLNGMDITSVTASTYTAGVGSATTLNVVRRRGLTEVDVLSSELSIAATEYTTTSTGINTSNDDLVTGDKLYVDISAISSGTAADGLSVTITATTP